MKLFKRIFISTSFSFLFLFSFVPLSHADFPIATTAGNEFAMGFGFDGTNYLIGIHGDETNDASITAQLISQTGALVGPRIKTGRTGETFGGPFISFDGTRYLLLWTDGASAPNNDIYGQFISTAGALIGTPFPVIQTAGFQHLSGLAFDGTNYFITWEDLRPSAFNDLDNNGQCSSNEGTCSDVYGQFLTPAGALLGPEVPIHMGLENEYSPSVLFDGTRYLVAWSSYSAGPGGVGVYAQFIDTSGAFIGARFLISESISPSYNPASIVYNGTNYLAAWNYDVGLGYPNPTIWDVRGRVFDSSGSFLGPEFSISSEAGSQLFPIATLSSDGTSFIVTWTDDRNDVNNDWICDPGEGTCIDIYGQSVSSTGDLIGFEFPIIKMDGNQMFSPLIFDGTQYLAYWNNIDTFMGTVGDVYGRFVDIRNFADYQPLDLGNYWIYENAIIPLDTYTNSVFEEFTYAGNPAVKFGTDPDNYAILYNDGSAIDFYAYVEGGVVFDIPDLSIGPITDGTFINISGPNIFELFRLWDNLDPTLKSVYNIDPTLTDLLILPYYDSNYPPNSQNVIVESNLGYSIPYSVTGIGWVQPGIGEIVSIDVDAATGALVDRYDLIDTNVGVVVDPVPDIKANGLDGPVVITPGSPLSVTVALASNDLLGTDADWWVLADTGDIGSGSYRYNVGTDSWIPGQDVTYQGALFDLATREVLNMAGLPTGSYTLSFEVDTTMNGIKDTPIYSDSVVVTVAP